MEEISFSDFEKVQIRIGTVVAAEMNEKARKPAYSMKVDFGVDIGLKSTSAQITEEHQIEEIIGSQVVAVMNFPPKNVAGVVSEVLVLAVVEQDGRTILLSPAKPVKDGSRIL
jgi:tRNA-binding protein